MSLLNHSTSSIAQLRNIYNMLCNSSNPQAMLNDMAKSNPNLAWVMQMCNGSNPKDVFYSMCKERNVNPEDILNQFK